MSEASTAFTPPSIVVGVDGSRASEQAAVWGVCEAVGRGLPLHLLAAADGPEAAMRAEATLHSVAAAAGSSVAVTTEVVAGKPVETLQFASRSAAMICVGAVGISHIDHPVGSTVRALAASAHCPLAVVRGKNQPGWVVVELDETSDSAAVLQYAVEEARLRHAPLRVLATWQSDSGGGTPDGGNRLVRAQLDRRLETWRHRYPDLDVEPIAVHGSGMEYLAAHGPDTAVVVIGARNVIGVNEVLGQAGLNALPNTSLLIIDRQVVL